jgi:hypothetical protein
VFDIDVFLLTELGFVLDLVVDELFCFELIEFLRELFPFWSFFDDVLLLFESSVDFNRLESFCSFEFIVTIFEFFVVLLLLF